MTRRNRFSRLKFTCICLFSCLTVALPLSHAQSSMPNGWQSLTADEFAQAARSLFASATPPTEEHRDEVMLHGWNEFLVDESFVAGEDLDTVLDLIDIFGGERPEGVDAATVEALLANVNARLGDAETDLSGIDFYHLGNLSKGLPSASTGNELDKVGEPKLASPSLFARWMEANDWQSLETKHLYNLFGFVNADAVDRRHFSARWTGTLTAPQTGNYVLSQHRVYKGDDSQLKVWIDDVLVLDSSNGEDDPNCNRLRNATLTPMLASGFLPHTTWSSRACRSIAPGKVLAAIKSWKPVGVSRSRIMPRAAYRFVNSASATI